MEFETNFSDDCNESAGSKFFHLLNIHERNDDNYVRGDSYIVSSTGSIQSARAQTFGRFISLKKWNQKFKSRFKNLDSHESQN